MIGPPSMVTATSVPSVGSTSRTVSGVLAAVGSAEKRTSTADADRIATKGPGPTVRATEGAPSFGCPTFQVNAATPTSAPSPMRSAASACRARIFSLKA